MKDVGDKIVNAVLFPFGRCRVKLDEWPHTQLDRAVAAIKAQGWKFDREHFPNFEIHDVWFRLGKQRIRLTIVDFGNAYLWGSRRLVRNLAAQIVL
jgi:hypothetical protein